MSVVKNNTLQNALAARWASLAQRERVLVGSAVALIFVALLWWIGIAPALAKIKQAREAAPQLDAQLQQMRVAASEATTLKAQRLLSYDESLRSLENSIKTLGTGATLSVNDARASILLRGVSGAALAQWLAQVRANARLVPSELRLKQAAAGGAAVSPATPTAWDGTIVLSLPAR
jgi:general secretion pathway protein M